MAKKEENKSVIENQEVLQEKVMGFEHWLETHPKTIFSIVGILLLAVAGYFGFNYFKNSQDAEAQKQMFQAVYYFESDSLNLALNGDGNNLGFIDIIDEFKYSNAANLAHFYAGVCYLKQGNYDAAILYLSDYSGNDLLVQPRAYSLIGDAYMELQKYEDAVKYYDKAANYQPNKFYSPAYLMKAALAYEKLNQNDKAKEAYEKIITEYWDSSEYQNAVKLKARLETNS
ncbi:MAG TPA: tetratricopeptide repeat protein [Cyclobacteriaceae bacterium]